MRHRDEAKPDSSATVRQIECEVSSRSNPNASYQRFMSEADPMLKPEAGKDLIRSIFGEDAISEGPQR